MIPIDIDIDAGRPPALHLRGVVLPEGDLRDLYVVDGRITFRRPAQAVAASAVLDGGYLLPGLVDTHAHLGLSSPAPADAPPEARVRASARAQLMAGVLAVREPGGPDYASASVGPREGLPRVVTGGRILAPPGRYFPNLAREVSDEDLPAAAEQEARASGAWAKVIADFPVPGDAVRPTFSPQSLAEAARRVHAVGARMAVHATTADVIAAAIAGGVDSIEHGWGIEDSHLRAMARRGIVLVPTLTILADAPVWLPELGLTAAALRVALDAAERHPEMTRRAADAGVLVLAGTDAGMGPHGTVAQEIRLLMEAGLPREMALAAGSWSARRFLGLSGIEEGAPADLVAYPQDPRAHPEVLDRPTRLILDGRLLSVVASSA